MINFQYPPNTVRVAIKDAQDPTAPNYVFVITGMSHQLLKEIIRTLLNRNVLFEADEFASVPAPPTPSDNGRPSQEAS